MCLLNSAPMFGMGLQNVFTQQWSDVRYEVTKCVYSTVVRYGVTKCVYSTVVRYGVTKCVYSTVLQCSV